MLIKNLLNVYNLLLSLGAFYLGMSMFSGKGIFEIFPQEWIGVLPFNSWASLALFGIIVFGFGNGIVATYGFMKKDNKIFIMTFTMGALLFLCTVIPTTMLGEWYLPTSAFLVLSIIQIALGIIGFVINYLFSSNTRSTY